jgi:hypothetical protein
MNIEMLREVAKEYSEGAGLDEILDYCENKDALVRYIALRLGHDHFSGANHPEYVTVSEIATDDKGIVFIASYRGDSKEIHFAWADSRIMRLRKKARRFADDQYSLHWVDDTWAARPLAQFILEENSAREQFEYANHPERIYADNIYITDHKVSGDVSYNGDPIRISVEY